MIEMALGAIQCCIGNYDLQLQSMKITLKWHANCFYWHVINKIQHSEAVHMVLLALRRAFQMPIFVPITSICTASSWCIFNILSVLNNEPYVKLFGSHWRELLVARQHLLVVSFEFDFNLGIQLIVQLWLQLYYVFIYYIISIHISIPYIILFIYL